MLKERVALLIRKPRFISVLDGVRAWKSIVRRIAKRSKALEKHTPLLSLAFGNLLARAGDVGVEG